MGQDENINISTERVDTLERVKLDGIDQWISIKGKNKKNPALLWLSGGPGGSEMPIVNSCNSDLQNIFTVVNWDQRGAGKSFSKDIPKETINVEQFMSDTHELVEFIKKRLNKEKIFIVGHSWGTLLGLTEVYRHPESILAYVGIGQMVNGRKSEQISYDFAMKSAKSNNDKSALKKLLGKAEFRDGSYVNGQKGCIAQRSVLSKYGGILYNKQCTNKLIKMFLSSHDYTFKDKINWQIGQSFTIGIMSIDWEYDVDFPNKVKKVEVPVHFFAGKHDYCTPFELVEKYCDMLEAPSKEIVFFENSAHSPMFEEPQNFFKEMSRVCEQTLSEVPLK